MTTALMLGIITIAMIALFVGSRLLIKTERRKAVEELLLPYVENCLWICTDRHVHRSELGVILVTLGRSGEKRESITLFSPEDKISKGDYVRLSFETKNNLPRSSSVPFGHVLVPKLFAPMHMQRKAV